MNARRLQRFFELRRESGQPLVLATVIDTGGSTYSKAGDFMLIDGAGPFCGMLSGGCLEGDLVERARMVLEHGAPQTASYDLSPDDELFGLGVGCDGTMHIFLQPLSLQNNYEPFVEIANAQQGRAEATVRLSEEYSIDVAPLPALLVLGAGADSEPVVSIAAELGWRCVVLDHRPAYVAARDYASNADIHCVDADTLAEALDLSGFDMALVMSHNLRTDRSYLSQLADSDIEYVGLLGPPNRRDRLLGEIGSKAGRLEGRLSAPAGTRLGGRGPGAIAVEIIAEMQQFLSQR